MYCSKLNFSRLPQWALWACCLLLAGLPIHYSLAADDDEGGHSAGDNESLVDVPAGASDEGLQAMGSFRKPEGWEISLFAAEPELANPVALTVDNQGRVWICETFRQSQGVTDNRAHDQEWLLADLAAQTVQDRIDYHHRLLGEAAEEYTAHDDRIRMLEDKDGDHVADRAVMFAKGFNKLEDGTGAGILVHNNNVYYTCIPKLWMLSDNNGDDQSDTRVALSDGYGVRVAFRGHDSHGLVIGPDGRLYFSIGDRGYNIETPDGRLKNVESGAVFRCELDGSNLEVFATGLRNPQELAFDDYGYLFTGDNNSDSGDKARWVNVMEGGETGWRMMYQYLPDRGPFNREKIWYPYSVEESPAYIVPPIENIGDGPSGVAVYPGTGLTGDFDNCFFMVDFRGGPSNSGIRLIRTQPKGAFWTVERSEEPIWSILATDACFGPDGAIYVCDWVNGWVGEGKGRVYRFTDPEAQKQPIVAEVKQLLNEGFQGLEESRLGELLRHQDRRVRSESQWELAKRGTVAEFVKLSRDKSADTIPRLHAIWGLGHAARLNPKLRQAVSPALRAALADSDLNVRAAAVAVAGDLKLKRFAEQIVSLISDPEPRVQYAACLAAGKLQLAKAVEPVATMLAANADQDPGLRHGGIMAMKGILESDALAAMKDHASRSVRIAAVVALRKQMSPAIVAFLGDEDAQVQLEAARAIHDVPEIQSAMQALAGLAGSELRSDALKHRVMNAHFRLNLENSAQVVAAFAADASHSDMIRQEAVEMLGAWGKPGELDRVMNRYQPLDARDAAPAAKAFEANLAAIMSGSNEVVGAAIQSASELGVTGAADLLAEMASNTDKDTELRVNALAGLVKISGADAKGLVNKLVDDGDASVRGKALELLTELDPIAAVPRLAKAVKSDSSAERQAAWDALGRLDVDEAKVLLAQGVKDYIAGTLPGDVWLNVKEAAAERVSAEDWQALVAFETKAAETDPLAPYQASMHGGDVRAGRDLFFNKTELSCVRCHKVRDVGGEVGPDLTEIAKKEGKDARYLLESIVNPDAKIAENFETIILLTEDEEIISGILRKETDEVVELINADGKIIELNPDDIVSRKKGKSAMPVDLVKLMTARELRDLVAYLESLDGTRRGFFGRRAETEE